MWGSAPWFALSFILVVAVLASLACAGCPSSASLEPASAPLTARPRTHFQARISKVEQIQAFLERYSKLKELERRLRHRREDPRPATTEE